MLPRGTTPSKECASKTRRAPAHLERELNVTTFEEIKLTGNLPSPAGVGVRILELTRSEDYSVDEMGAAIMADPSLTGRILQLANRGERTGSKPATTVEEAIMRLGSRMVRDLALAFSLVSERSTGACQAFDYEQYWSASLARAVSAQVISRRLEQSRPEVAYVCGLVSDVGRLALASVYADSYGKVLTNHGERTLDELIQKENEVFKIDHAQIGRFMLLDWGLPDLFGEASLKYASQRSIQDLQEIEDLADILRVAYWLAEALVTPKEGSNYRWRTIGEELQAVMRLLGMNEAQLSAFGNTCVKEWVDWGKAFDVTTEQSRKFKDVLKWTKDHANAQLPATPIPAEEKPSAEESAAQPTSQPQPRKEGQQEEAIRVIAIGPNAGGATQAWAKTCEQHFEVRCVASGEEGLKESLKWGADIVLADEQNTDLSGVDICKSLRSNDLGSSLYLIVIGQSPAESRGLAAFAAGADDFVELPSPNEVLGARIQAGGRVVELQRRVERDKATMMRQVAELGVLTRKLRATALTDALTEMPNRRYAMKRLESEWSSTQRTGRPISVVMLDVDHFKSVNDTYGHDVGDEVLKETAKVIQSSIRTSDEACRIGGEEFVVICKNTDEDAASIVAERIRSAMEAHVIEFGGMSRAVTASLGVAGYTKSMETVNDLLKRADEAVYAAKHGGRNQWVVANEIDQVRKSA